MLGMWQSGLKWISPKYMLNIGVTTVNKSTVWDRIKYVFHMCFLLFMTARGGAVYGSIKLKINPLQAICSKQIRQTMWMAKTEPVFFFFLEQRKILTPLAHLYQMGLNLNIINTWKYHIIMFNRKNCEFQLFPW